MQTTSSKEALGEEERAKAATKEEADRILRSTEQEIDAAVKVAKRDLTTYVADLALSLASKQIHVDMPVDELLVRRFTKQVSSDGSEGSKA
ncbi:MAG: hypothetical protein JO356_21825 [Acidobacteria bacterium]|nr:hypothetical protein [Acidobacteriota bacterium]